MKTLLTLFGKERSELETEIDKATTLKQVIKLVQNRLDGIERNYIGELSVGQVRLVKFSLDTLRQSLATFTAANEPTVSFPSGQITNQAPRFSPNSLILKLLQVLISISILVSLFSLTQDAPGAWMAILLMSVLIGLEALQFDKDNQENRPGSPELTEAPQPLVQIDSKSFLDNLADALSNIDHAVAQAEIQKPLGINGIEEMPEILDFLQKLWSASFFENPQMTLELSKLIPQILTEQGIRVENYLPNNEHSREYFDFEPSIDRSAKDYVTLTPALLKGDRVIRRGRVIEPVYSGAKD